MKKISLIIMLLMAFVTAASAQNKKMKIAVMDFKAGVGVNANEVEGLSDMLINTMYESGKFSIVERSQINQVLKEQKFQASELTNEQLAQVGRILGVESVLIGTVNFLAEHKNLDGSMTGEYNVDVRAVDVESGEVMTTAGGTKSPGSTYRAMMEEIARKLAVNIGGGTPPPPTHGLLTKGGDLYYLDGKPLTNEQYMELIQNCPEAWARYSKGRKQNRTGTILLISGGSLIVTGLAVDLLSGNFGTYGVGIALFGGVPIALASIPFYIAGSSKKNNAYKVYNQYCSKPTASLSFGPATKGIGMGVYLNF